MVLNKLIGRGVEKFGAGKMIAGAVLTASLSLLPLAYLSANATKISEEHSRMHCQQLLDKTKGNTVAQDIVRNHVQIHIRYQSKTCQQLLYNE